MKCNSNEIVMLIIIIKQMCELRIVTDVIATAMAHEYYLKVVPTVVDEVAGKDLLYACQYTYAKKVSK